MRPRISAPGFPPPPKADKSPGPCRDVPWRFPGSMFRRRQRDAALAIRLHHSHHRAMQQDRPDRSDQPMRARVRLPERIREQNARASSAMLPRHHSLMSSTIVAGSRQRKIGNPNVHSVTQRLTRHQLERPTGRIRLSLVVAGDDPDLAFVFDAHLAEPSRCPAG